MAKFYKQEECDGIAEAVAASAMLEATSEVLNSVDLVDLSTLAFATNLRQPDLHYDKSLLVRTGFNLNWDFFPAADTWAARKTPIDKLVDIDHDREQIIGHQTDAVCIDDDGEPIDESAYADGSHPDSFSIIDTDVIYLLRGTAEKRAEIAEMVVEISRGEWWVSMEAKFDNFDYITVPMVDTALAADMSQSEIIVRTEETAHLSKYLRAYNPKATNTYQGKRIGRVLRDITFAGKGYVRVPANPTSAVYTLEGVKLSSRIHKGKSSLIKAAADLVYKNSDPIKETETMDELDKIKAELAAATEKLAKADDEMDDAKKVQESLKADKLAALEEVKATNLKMQSIQSELDKNIAFLESIAADKRFAETVDRVMAAYKVDSAKAAEIATTLKALDADTLKANLDAVAAAIAAVVPAPVVAVETPKPPKEELPVIAALVVETPSEKPLAVASEKDAVKGRIQSVSKELSKLAFGPGAVKK